MAKPCSIDPEAMTPIRAIKGDSQADTMLLRKMAEEATKFLSSQTWCERLEDAYFAFGIGGVVAVFFLKLLPISEDIDSCLWVIVGDLPPAYIVVEGNPTSWDALDAYCSEMEAWINAVERGISVEHLIPVNAPATPEYANELKGRIQFLRSNVLPFMPSGEGRSGGKPLTRKERLQ